MSFIQRYSFKAFMLETSTVVGVSYQVLLKGRGEKHYKESKTLQHLVIHLSW